MLTVEFDHKFHKDLKRTAKRGKKTDRLWTIIDLLRLSKPLPAKHRPHKLVGNWAPAMECHIEPDWLLIYLISGNTLRIIRTGTHADLFE